MKVIFCDIDGVLNTLAWAEAARGRYRGNPTELLIFELMGRFDRLVATTGARVVISSTWRENYTAAGFTTIFRSAGATFDVYDTTQLLSKPRGIECRTWLERHGREVTSYVILDDWDEGEFAEFGRDRLVTTRPNLGLQDDDVVRATHLLATPVQIPRNRR